MYLVGLTGGIASGKSTVADIWSDLGAVVVDADHLAREVVEPGTYGLKEVVGLFGPKVINPDGTVNRKQLAQLVFADPALRLKLEGILHPLIQSLARDRIAAADSEIVVYVIPLLAETNSDMPFDLVVTVEAPENVQVSRLIDNRSMSKEDATQRIRAQASPASRAKLSDHILNSNQALELLKKDAVKLFSEIEKSSRLKLEEG